MNILKDDILQEIIHRIVEVAKPERIIMFGSAVCGKIENTKTPSAQRT